MYVYCHASVREYDKTWSKMSWYLQWPIAPNRIKANKTNRKKGTHTRHSHIDGEMPEYIIIGNEIKDPTYTCTIHALRNVYVYSKSNMAFILHFNKSFYRVKIRATLTFFLNVNRILYRT